VLAEPPPHSGSRVIVDGTDGRAVWWDLPDDVADELVDYLVECGDIDRVRVMPYTNAEPRR
jgi:hypothetical protein